MVADRQNLAALMGWSCELVNGTFGDFDLSAAEKVARICAGVRHATRDARDVEDLVLHRLAVTTENLLVSLMCHGRDVDDALKGDVRADLEQWKSAMREFQELRDSL
ncbi:hypothetical protein [Mycobacterium sp. E2989]|uniref:hypothetical protein n=1 Tax=Mycobacterium sp. E2989 TaxID=1834140 RepID=UPI0007FF091F|nr:hypothetical protein [Mycobacterium sp. E2989]OBH84388.1 hypothetical protein A5680_09665 [Mycobacterium sp. E2989]